MRGEKLTSIVLDDLESFEHELRKDTHATDAMKKLTVRCHVPREPLLSLLLRIPRASRNRQLVASMEDRNLKVLPSRICKWADLIEKVNQSPWLSPSLLPSLARSTNRAKQYPVPLNKTLDREFAEITAEHFDRLPNYLRLYARHLGAWLERFHGRGRRERGVGTRPHPQLMLTLRMIKLVMDATGGRPHYPELARLLTLAYTACGKRKEITEDALSHVVKDNPWAADLVLRPELFKRFD